MKPEDETPSAVMEPDELEAGLVAMEDLLAASGCDCPYCGQRFSKPFGARRHVKESCDDCPDILKKHFRRLECAACGERCKNQFVLRRHRERKGCPS